MVFQRFGIDARLAQAAEGLEIDFFFYEKLLSHSVGSQENILAKLDLDEGREEVLMLPALQWLLSGLSRKVLVLVADSGRAESCAQAIERLGAGAGIAYRIVTRDSDGALRMDGASEPTVLIGKLDDLLASSEEQLREYGFLVVDGAELLAELPIDSIRRFAETLLPSWERRTLLACGKHSAKAKAFARELANDLVEVSIDGEAAKAQSVAIETWDLPGEAKLKFLLGLLARQPVYACVFCNLRDTAEEVFRRLEANGIGSDYILGALALDRKLAAQASVTSGARRCLVVTDQGAEGLELGVFPLVVNYDIPLEPELFVKRIEMLDRGDPEAKIVNLACDRYVYGLPAIESYIDARLNALPPEQSMLSVEDKSEGLSLSGRRRAGPESDGRRQGGQSAANKARDDGRRDQHQRDGRSRDGYGREDRSPDIRKSISEATGGSLDMGNSVPAEPRRVKPEQKPRPERRSNTERRPPQASRRPEGKRDAQRRGDKPKEQTRRANSSRQNGPRVSYDMPIEERMRQYREKYGQGLDGSQRGSQRAPAQKGGQQRNDQPRPPRVSLPTTLAPKTSTEPPKDKPKGLFGRLFGTLKNKRV